MSKNFEKVEFYYKRGFWSLEQVKNAVNRWITPEEYKQITGEDYTA